MATILSYIKPRFTISIPLIGYIQFHGNFSGLQITFKN